MIKDSNKYVNVKFTNEEDAKLTEFAKQLHISKSALIGFAASVIFTFKSGEALGEALVDMLKGDRPNE